MPWNRVLNFTDPLPCQAAITGSDVEILPTAKGSFQVEITQIGMNRLWMQRFHISLPQISIFVAAPERRSIGFLLDSSSSPLQHCGLDVLPGDIVINQFDLAHQRSGNDHHYGTMSLPIDEMEMAGEAIMGRAFTNKLNRRIIHPHPASMSRLLKLHKAVGQLSHDAPDILEQPEVRRALEGQLMHVMVRCLAESVGVETTTGGRRHDAIVARFEEFLAGNPDRPLYLTEICAAIGVAERTLRASCEEHLGMGPVRYLTLRRMHLTRRALLRADPSRSTVTRIVTDHGFLGAWPFLGRLPRAVRRISFRDIAAARMLRSVWQTRYTQT